MMHAYTYTSLSGNGTWYLVHAVRDPRFVCCAMLSTIVCNSNVKRENETRPAIVYVFSKRAYRGNAIVFVHEKMRNFHDTGKYNGKMQNE